MLFQVKIELLDNKHVQDVVQQLQRLLKHLTTFYDQCHQLLDGQRFFPIEVDLAKGAFTYESVSGLCQVYNIVPCHLLDMLHKVKKKSTKSFNKLITRTSRASSCFFAFQAIKSYFLFYFLL